MTDFQIDCFQNQFLPEGKQIMHAVLGVRTSETEEDGGSEAGAEDRTELLIVDISGSMNGEKLRAAKTATSAAIDCIPDGVRFAIIAGYHEADLAYPLSGTTAVSSVESRTEAKREVKGFEARGGTAIGRWVELAQQVLGESPGIRHAILLTDGKNENEEPEQLDESLRKAEGSFQCDCRGVGANWVVAELKKVATALRGTYDIVADPSGLEADFSDLMMQSLERQVPELTLRVWTPQGAEVVSFKQLEPRPLDLTESRAIQGPLVGDYTTGSWGDEYREFFLTVRLPVGEVGDEILAARVSVLVDGEPVGQALAKAVWTDDTSKSVRMEKKVADAIGEGELADAIHDGVDALRDGDMDTARIKLGKAVQIADKVGNEDAIELISKLADIEDRPTGRVRPRAKIDDEDMLKAEIHSTRITRTRHRFKGTDLQRCETCKRPATDALHRVAGSTASDETS